MAYVLKNVLKKLLHPHKGMPNKQNVTIPLPYGQFKNPSTLYGSIVIDKRNITEVNDTTVDVTLYFDEYDITFKDNDGKYKKKRTSSEQIYQHYLFFQLLLKEQSNAAETPLYLRGIYKNLFNKLHKDSDKYTLFTHLPQRLQHLARNINAEDIPSGYVNINDENDIVANGTTNTFDIRLQYTSYVVWFYDKNDIIQYFQITRGEFFEAFSKFQESVDANRKNTINNIIEAEIASSTNDYEILRHINQKSVSYYDNSKVTVAVDIPESLKDKASTWWCSITVHEANIINEGKYKNNYFVSVKLYQTEYQVDIPITPTSNFKRDIRTKWEHFTVPREELIAANEKQIQKNADFFKDFDRLVKP